jgi:hypothetical protein
MSMLNKVKRINRNRLMIAGLQKNHVATDTVLVDGVPVPQNQLVATFQASSDAADATAAAEVAYHKAVADEDAANAKADTTFTSLKEYFLVVNKSTPLVLNDYGLEPVVKSPPTVATKAAAVVKLRATRAARGTKGKKQAAAIKALPAASPAPALPPATSKS